MVLSLKEILDSDEKFPAQSFGSAKRTGQVSGNRIRCCMNAVHVKDLNVPFEIRVQHRKLINRDLEC
jgi:hypothetical protein